MRRALITLFLFAFLTVPSFAQDPSPFIQRNETDEFTGNKVVVSRFTDVPVTQNNGERVQTSVGAVFYSEGNYLLLVYVKSEGWNFLSENTAYFVIDGERYQKTLYKFENDMDTEGMNVSLSERIGVRLDHNFRTVLETADRARMKAGGVVFNVTPVVDDEVWAVEEVVNQKQ